MLKTATYYPLRVLLVAIVLMWLLLIVSVRLMADAGHQLLAYIAAS